MKKLILFFLLIISIGAMAQGRKPGFTQFFSKNQNIGNWSDSVNNTPVKDTVSAPVGIGEKRFRMADSTEYIAIDTIAGHKRWKASGGNGVDSLNSQYSVIGNGKSSNKFRLNRDTSLTSNTLNLVYGFQGDNVPHYYKNVPDSGSNFGMIGVTRFASVAALKASYVNVFGAKRAWTDSYYGDGDAVSGAEYSYSSTSTATSNDQTVIRPTNIPNDSYPGRWLYIPKNGAYNGRELGMKADGTTDNYSILQSLINSGVVSYGYKIVIPDASNYYYFSNTITIKDKPIHIQGVNRSTKLLFPAGDTAFYITRTSGYDFELLENLVIYASGTVSDVNHIYDGIHCEAVATIRNCEVHNFSGDGIEMNGDISAHGTNVSNSRIENCVTQQNGGSGVNVVGLDANGIYVDVDSRDNGQYGVRDSSFLGIKIVGGEYHNNAMGHYRGLSLSGFTSQFGSYYESGSPTSVCDNHVIVIPSYNGTSWSGNYVSVITGFSASQLFANDDATLNRFGLWVESGKARFGFQGSPNYGFSLKNLGGRSGYDLNLQWQHSHEGSSVNLGGFLSAEVTYNYKGRTRQIRTSTLSVEHELRGGVFYQTATGVDSLSLISSPYFPADRVINKGFTGNNVEGWVCIQQGSIAPELIAGVGLSTLTGTCASGNNKILLAGDPNVQKVIGEGDVITIGGNIRTVTSRDSTYPYTLTVDANLPVISSPTYIFPVSPKWRADGTSVGNSSDMSTLASSLTSNDISYKFYNIDSSKMFWWNGSAFATISGGGGGGGSTAWGTITGTLSSQTDLQTALNAKQNTLTMGTSGQLPYMNSGGTDFNYSAHYKWDATNKILYVGDATVSPTGALIKVAARDAEGGYDVVYGGTTYAYFHANTASGYVKMGSDLYPVQLWSGGNQVFNFSSGGNVGVGMAPNVKLDVNGDIANANTNRNYRLQASGTSSAPTYSFWNNTNNGWYAPTNDEQSWVTGGTERLRLTGSSLSVKNTLNLASVSTYSSGGYDLLVKNQTSGDVEKIASIPTLAYGTYEPTVSGSSNVTSSTTYSNVMYTRVGSVVTVSGKITITPTASGQVSWQISLPVSTANFSSDGQAGGTGYYVNGTSTAGAKIAAVNGAQTVTFVYRAPDTAVADIFFTFQYTIQ